jgi:hypothetical protein
VALRMCVQQPDATVVKSPGIYGAAPSVSVTYASEQRDKSLVRVTVEWKNGSCWSDKRTMGMTGRRSVAKAQGICGVYACNEMTVGWMLRCAAQCALACAVRGHDAPFATLCTAARPLRKFPLDCSTLNQTSFRVKWADLPVTGGLQDQDLLVC